MRQFANNASSVLAHAISADAVTIMLSAGSGDRFPQISGGGEYFDMTLIRLDANGNENGWEILKVTARDGDQLTVKRGQDGTLALGWPAGSRAELRLTAEALNRFERAAYQPESAQSVLYEYDERGLPIKSVEQIGGDSRTVFYAYTPSGLPERVTTHWKGVIRTEIYSYTDGVLTGMQATEDKNA